MVIDRSGISIDEIDHDGEMEIIMHDNEENEICVWLTKKDMATLRNYLNALPE